VARDQRTRDVLGCLLNACFGASPGLRCDERTPRLALADSERAPTSQARDRVGYWPQVVLVPLGRVVLHRRAHCFDELALVVSFAQVMVLALAEEKVVGRAALASYIRKEAEDQGTASVRMGRPVIDGDRVAAEFLGYAEQR
jgi:hypothetical protein